MLGRRNIRDSIGYVTLGLFSHALLDELLEARREPEAPPVRKEMVNRAIDSLRAISSPERVEPSRWRNLAFQNYQEIRTLFATLEEQEGKTNIEELAAMLEGIVSEATEKDNRLEDIQKTMDFFRSLARTAVMNAESPEEQVPPSIRKLVAS